MGKDNAAGGDDLSSVLRAAVAPIVEGLGVELVSLEVKGPHNKRIVRLVGDADGGLDIDRIAEVSNAIGATTDEVVPGSYTLEVSSPGLDRPLTLPIHFSRNIGREVEVRHAAGDTDTQTTGTIETVSDEAVELATRKGSVAIPFAELFEGRIVLPW